MDTPTLLHQYWSHVFSRSDGIAVLLKKGEDLKQRSYHPLTWRDSGKIVANIMSFLNRQGLEKGQRVAILGWNSPQWVWIDLAVQSLGGVTVPIYPNTSANGACEVLLDSDADFIFADEQQQLDKVQQELLAGKSVRKFLFDESLSGVSGLIDAIKCGDCEEVTALLNMQTTKEALAFARYQWTLGLLPDARAPATIIFTSGSTGKAKGALLTHGNIAAACMSLTRHGFDFNADDVYLSYLPLAHVYERVSGQAMCLWNAVPVAFCTVPELASVLPIVRPTILVGVPAVWRKIRETAMAKLQAKTGLTAKLVRWALTADKPGLKRTLADLIVFRQVRAGLGGRLRYLVSGGAAIDQAELDFFALVGLPLLQGYGMTETSGGIATETPHGRRYGSVGKLIDCVQVKLVPNPDNPDPRKQLIYLRGDCIFGGYHNLPEVNASSFTDGFFYTGDLGYVDEDGYLFITGRKKREGKTEGGKYYSPERIENAFSSSQIIQCLVPIGDGRPYIGALFFLNVLEASKLPGVPEQDAKSISALGSNPQVQRAVFDAVAIANQRLEHWETVQHWEIVPEEATVANGLLTPTLKVRAEVVMAKYKHLIEAIYSHKR